MRLNFILLFIAGCSFLSFSPKAFSQSQTLNDVTKFEAAYFNTIKDDKGVIGYFTFFKTDKAPKGMAAFKLNIYDTEFNIVSEKKMTEGKYTRLLSSNSNGRTILFRFFDPKTYKIKYKGYNFQGEQVITKMRTVTNKSEKMLFAKPNPYNDYMSVVPIPGYGFAEYTLQKKEKLTYGVTYYPDDKATRTWTKSGKSNKYESASRITTIEDLIITLVYSREKLMGTKGMENHIVAHDVKDGSKRFDINLNDLDFNTLILGGEAAPDKENIILYGLDYEKDKKVSSKSIGLNRILMNKEGEVLDRKTLNWERDFNFKDDEDRDYGNMHIHEFVNGPNGHTFIVAEQIGLNVGMTALGSGLAAMGGGTPNVTFKIEDLIIIELDADFKVVDMEIIEKSRNSFTIGGIPFGSITAIGMMAKAYGYFDFTYLQKGEKLGDFDLGYVDYERKSGEKNSFVFGGVARTGGNYAKDKFDISKKKTVTVVRQAKPGYVTIVEYNRKEKTLDLRLERLNF